MLEVTIILNPDCGIMRQKRKRKKGEGSEQDYTIIHKKSKEKNQKNFPTESRSA
jgi:hypothetical protein